MAPLAKPSSRSRISARWTPADGAPVSQPTTAYLSYDSKNLYVGWICKDDPAKIRARIAKRKDIESDDRVTINIDTFHDHNHAYWFDVNPYAIQFDGITTDGQGDDRSWEGLWGTEAQFTADGYVVLETIPFRSLRFPNAPKQVWGRHAGALHLPQQRVLDVALCLAQPLSPVRGTVCRRGDCRGHLPGPQPAVHSLRVVFQ